VTDKNAMMMMTIMMMGGGNGFAGDDNQFDDSESTMSTVNYTSN